MILGSLGNCTGKTRPSKKNIEQVNLKQDVSEFTEPLSVSKLVLHDSGMSLKLYNADTYLKTKYQADEPDTECVRICEFMNTSFSCCGLRYSGTPLNLHTEYNALTDKSQAAEPEKKCVRN